MKQILRSALLLPLAMATLPAYAFDPNEGAEPQGQWRSNRSHYETLRNTVIPNRYYVDPANTAPRPNITMAPVAAPMPATIPYTPPAPAYTPAPAAVASAPAYEAAPALRQVPAEQPTGFIAPAPVYSTAPVNAPAITYAPAPAPAYAAPTATGYAAPGYIQPSYRPEPSMAPAPQPNDNASSYRPSHTRRDSYSIGIEGFYDEYQEDIVDLTDKGYFGGITAGYTHYFNDRWYGAVDLAAAYGSTDYESISGTIDSIPQWTIESRAVGGYNLDLNDNRHLKTYIGLSSRYFSDELKGKVSSLGSNGYDRRIFQIFMPIGATYEFAAAGWDFAPNLEFAPLLWGNVSSRLGTLPGYSNLENRQSSGYSLRGEFMMGRLNDRGAGWQFGPFFRYWDIPDSDVESGGYEPENTRLQLGAGMKYLF